VLRADSGLPGKAAECLRMGVAAQRFASCLPIGPDQTGPTLSTDGSAGAAAGARVDKGPDECQ